MDETEKKYKTEDARFKRTIHDSDVLSWIIRSNVDEFKDKTIDEIKACLEIEEDGHTVKGRETEIYSEKEGKIVTDTIFDLKDPDTESMVSVIVNVEGQNDPDPGYNLEKRAEYYMARLVSAEKGRDFIRDNYNDLRKVYSIWIILKPLAKDRNTVTRYSMRAESIVGDPDRAMPVMDTFNILFIYVGSYDDSLPDASAFPAAVFKLIEGKEQQSKAEDRFKISFDDLIAREVIGTSSVGMDAYNHGFREGKAEGKAETEATAIEVAVSTILQLVNDEDWSLEKALSLPMVSADIRDRVEEAVRKQLD